MTQLPSPLGPNPSLPHPTGNPNLPFQFANDPLDVGVISLSYPRGDIRRHGAVSGGANDVNLTAFRNAISSIPNGVNGITGGVVFVPAGIWNINNQIPVTKNNVTMIFEVGAIINANVPSGDFAVIVAGPSVPVSNFVIDNGHIQGSFPWGIAVLGGSGHKILRMTIIGGIVPSGGQCGGIYCDGITDYEIAWNRCSGNGNAGLDGGADIQINNGDTLTEDGSIHDNKCLSTDVVFNIGVFNPIRVGFVANTCSGARVFSSTAAVGGYGIMMYNTAGQSGNSVSNFATRNIISSVEGIGIYVQNVHDTSVTDNDIDDCSSVMLDGSLTPAAITFEGLRGTVAINRIRNSHRHGIVVNGGATAALGGHGTKVIGNRISVVGLAGAGDGIAFSGVTLFDVSITGNFVTGINNGSAIGNKSFSDVAPTTRIDIQGNTITNVAAAGVGIFVGVATVDVEVKSNTLRQIAVPANGILLRSGSALTNNTNTINGIAA